MIVLLGAGASVAAGVPAVFAMTGKVRTHIRRLRDPALSSAFDLVAGGLQMTNPQVRLGDVDIEQVLTVSNLLANRARTELAPFVAAWHPLVESIDRRPFDRRNSERVANAVARMVGQNFGVDRGEYRRSSPPNIDPSALSRALTVLAEDITSRRDENVFGLLSKHIYASIIDLVWLDEAEATSVAYVRVPQSFSGEFTASAQVRASGN